MSGHIKATKGCSQVYVENLTASALLWILVRHRVVKVNYYAMSTGAQRLCQVLRCAHLAPGLFWLRDAGMRDARDETGSPPYARTQEDTLGLCQKIVSTHLRKEELKRSLGNWYDREAVSLYLEKVVMEQIERPVAILHIFRSHVLKAQTANEEATVAYFPRTIWSAAIREHGKRLGVTVEFYPQFRTLLAVARRLLRLWKRWGTRTTTTQPPANTARSISKGDRETISPVNPSKPTIAALYSGKAATFDLDKRSDWFWLLHKNVPREHVLIYFERTDWPETEAIKDVLQKHGVQSVALSRGATRCTATPIFTPSVGMPWLVFKCGKRFLLPLLRCLVSFQPISAFLWAHAARFIQKCVYWEEFIATNQVKVAVNAMDFAKSSVAFNLVLRKSGGVSVGYQFTNLEFPCLAVAGCADVYFAFGSAFRQIWERNGSRFDTLAYSGYITDHSFKPAREKAEQLRRQLVDRGVKFVLCYFDENSCDERHAAILTEAAQRSYRWFLTQVLEDETLGIIFKPQYPRHLVKRIGPLDGLFGRALRTGRCVLMDRGATHITEQYPAEAAQAADLCVGLLVSGTAALEAYLSGTPTVFLDLEQFYGNPVYSWGKDTVVFDNVDDLAKGIREFRENPAARSVIGNLSKWVADRDPFRDGRASFRMGQYIGWLFEKLSQNAPREEALDHAYCRYVEEWGEGAAVRYRDRRAALAGQNQTVHA